MKEKKFSIFRRITILVFALITILSVLFIALSYYATANYHLASTQLLNKDVAGHIVKFASPYTTNGINKSRADSVFKNAMVISPSAEVYFLDTAGNVLDFYGPKKDVILHQVSLENIDKYIASNGKKYIKAPDPRDPASNKIFSAAEVISNNKKLGYIYVILGNSEYRNANQMLLSSHITSLAIKAFIFIILLSVAFSLLYIKRIKKRFSSMVDVLAKFQNGDFAARFTTKDNDELTPVSQAFNKMADLLTYNINRLTLSENERKDFIANISHDLRTPIAIARGYAETLQIKKDEISNNEANSFIDIILKKISQVEQMVKSLFEISYMESPEFKAKKEPFVLSEIVQETVNSFQLNAKEKNVTLKCIQCQYHVWINGDIKLMERIIQNLIENAFANVAEKGQISVALEINENKLVLKIENNGPLLSEPLLHWINTENKDGKIMDKPASGLGLSITKKILSLHNSSLHAYTTSNENVFSFAIEIYKRELNK